MLCELDNWRVARHVAVRSLNLSVSVLPTVVARAPNHLGDGVMAIPALRALTRLSSKLIVVAPGWGPDLYRSIDCEVVARDVRPEGDVAVLFPPSFRVAWELRHISRRVGVAGDWRRALLTDVVKPMTHRVDTYAALVNKIGGQVLGPPSYPIMGQDSVPDVPVGHIGINPLSVSGETVQWGGFQALAKALEQDIVYYAGPGEEELLAPFTDGHMAKVGLPLPDFAAALSRCAVFVTNDSGAAHFARAVGCPTVVIYGSTIPSVTGPMGSVAVEMEGATLDCRPCYKKQCRVGGTPCLDIDVGLVLKTVRRLLPEIDER